MVVVRQLGFRMVRQQDRFRERRVVLSYEISNGAILPRTRPRRDRRIRATLYSLTQQGDPEKEKKLYVKPVSYNNKITGENHGPEYLPP